jgi:hypothetical protein
MVEVGQAEPAEANAALRESAEMSYTPVVSGKQGGPRLFLL